MAKIVYTKQIAKVEEDKMFLDISQRIEYEKKNMDLVLIDLKKELEDNKSNLAEFSKVKEQALKVAEKTYNDNINLLKEMLSMSEEDLKDRLYKDFVMQKERMKLSVDNEQHSRQLVIAEEKKRLKTLKEILEKNINRLEFEIDLYSKALKENK